MHPSIRSLLDLHEMNVQRHRMRAEENGRKQKLIKAKKQCEKVDEAALAARKDVDDMGALIRQYTADVERCEQTVQELREKQMTAKTNKEYLAVINGIEEAKAESKLRKASLETLNATVDAKEATAKAAEDKAALYHSKYAEYENKLATPPESGESLARLDEIYAEKKQAVDPAFLEVYERLVESNNQMPLVPVHPVTRATPLGVTVSNNQMEQIRNGVLVQDSMTNGILYIDESVEVEEANENS